jgi:hypothetical protein
MPYSGAPATVAADELKLLIGDLSTSSSGELLKSAECSYFIARFGTAKAAAPHAARAVAAMFADQVGKSVGDMRLDAQQKFEQYITLAASLERSASISAVPFAGGISVSQKRSVENDTDRVIPSFNVGLHDDPNLPSQSKRTST